MMSFSNAQGKIWVCNTDVESEWSQEEIDKTPKHDVKRVIFHHFEEILLSSISSNSTVVLRKEPDSHFIGYLQELGIKIPEILLVQGNEEEPWLPTTNLIIQDSILLNELNSRVREDKAKILESFGISKIIENIAHQTNLTLSYANSEISASISRKSFIRNLAINLGIPFPEGKVCENIKDIPRVVKNVRSKGGDCPVVIKPDLGASGKGQYVIQSQKDFESISNSIQDGKSFGYEPPYIVEQWYPNSTTFSYDFKIDHSGYSGTPIILREALERSDIKHYGYIYPAKYKNILHDIIHNTIKLFSTALNEKYGYYGPVKCDALILPDGRMFPVLELNARHSFFRFIDPLHKQLAPESVGVFFWFFFHAPGQFLFRKFIDQVIGTDLIFDKNKREGVVVPVWNTVTATEKERDWVVESPLRRLFLLVLGDTPAKVQNIENKVYEKLKSFY